MKSNRTLLIVTVLAALTLLSAALIAAQSSTPEPMPQTTVEATTVPSSFNDGRINGDIFLGGLAIYCVDQNGSSTAGNTFQGGGITVWGLNDQEYFTLTVDQLRGNEEIAQPPPTMEAGMTEEPMTSATEDITSTVLLARSNTPNGTMWFFRVGYDQFALQGNDNTGKFFTYTWTGCALGSLSTDTAPFESIEMTPMPALTAEATASS